MSKEEHHDGNEMLTVLAYYSGCKWTARKNTSWGITHKENFGEKEGYVVNYINRGGEHVVCSVIGQPFVKQIEIDANARLIELAPDMAKLIEKLAMLNENYYKDIAGFILSARELSARFVLKPDR